MEYPKCVMCSNCGEFLGILTWVNGAYWLQISGSQFAFTRGRCKTCKHFWFYNSRDYKMRRIAERAICK